MGDPLDAASCVASWEACAPVKDALALWDFGGGMWDFGGGVWDFGGGVWDFGGGVWDIGGGRSTPEPSC